MTDSCSYPASPPRVFLDKANPDVYKAMLAYSATVSSAAEEAGVPKLVVELVNARCSQLNRCPFCMDLHFRLARGAGASEQLLSVLPAWREVGLFDDMAKAALEIAELVTLLPDSFESDAGYDRAADVLAEDQLAALTWVAIAINAFNRVSVLSRHPVRRRD